MWSCNEAIIELAAAIFMKRLQQHGHEFRDETKLLAKAGGGVSKEICGTIRLSV